MTTIATDPFGTYLAVASDAYVGGKFVSDVIAPAASFDPMVLAAAVAIAFVAHDSVSEEPTPVPLPGAGLLLLGALVALGWRR